MDNYYNAVGGTRGKENFGLLVRAKPAQRHLWCEVKPGKNSEKRRVPLQTERYFDLHDMLWQKICQFLRHWTHKRRWFWCCGKISESNWPLYNAYMGDADVFDQRVNLYGRLLRGAVWYYKIFFLSHRSVCFKCTHFGKEISKSYHQNCFRLQKVIDKWLDWRKFLQEGHSNVAATQSWN